MTFDFAYWYNEYVENPVAIEYYDGSKILIENSPVFKNISKAIISRGYLKPEEFVNICIWKTPRQMKRYKNEKNLDKISNISKEIIAINKNRQSDCISQSLSLLVDLDGVRVPVASAILTILFPEKYCIIDYRVRRAIFFIDNFKNDNICFENYFHYSKTLDSLTNSPSIDVYSDYLLNITEKANKLNCTPRELEMALWKYDKQRGQNINHNHT